MNNSARRPFCGATIKRRPEKRRPRKSSEIRRLEKKSSKIKASAIKKALTLKINYMLYLVLPQKKIFLYKNSKLM